MNTPSLKGRAEAIVLSFVAMLATGCLGADQSPPTHINGRSQLVHVTSEYSNAVLRALMPHFAEFSEKTLEVISDLPRPLTLESVRSFQPNPTAGIIGGSLTLTNGVRISFGGGVIGTFRSPRDYFSLQDFSRIPEFYGTWKMNEMEAILLAEKTLQDLGYELSDVTHGWPRRIIAGNALGTNRVPFIQVRWENPEDQRFTSVRIDAENKTVVGLSLSTIKIKKPPPKVDVVPELLVDYRNRLQQEARGVDQQGAPAPPPVEPKRVNP